VIKLKCQDNKEFVEIFDRSQLVIKSKEVIKFKKTLIEIKWKEVIEFKKET